MGRKKKNRQPTMESAVKRELRSPLYRMRVVSSANEYKRSRKHKNADYQINRIFKSAINLMVSIQAPYHA